MKALHVMNLTHDLALANGTDRFKAPEVGVVITHDLSLLPLWYAHTGDVIISDLKLSEAFNPLHINIIVKALRDISTADFQEIIPWGWDAVLLRELKMNGLEAKRLPNSETIEGIRNLSHRKLSTLGMAYMREHLNISLNIPDPAEMCTNLQDIKNLIQKNKEVVMKSPWSSSGRGLFWCNKNLTPSISGWCKRILEKQGSVMIEEAMEKMQDFALEYTCQNGVVEFKGYSLFYTEGKGAYQGNALMTNEAIEDFLSKWIVKDELLHLRETTKQFVEKEIAPTYNGTLGVDMFMYTDCEGQISLDPMVEINIRMTMGRLSRQFYDNHCVEGVKGSFNIEHLPPGEILAAHEKDLIAYPLVLENNKIKSGYVSLCPISESTTYRAKVLIDEV